MVEIRTNSDGVHLDVTEVLAILREQVDDTMPPEEFCREKLVNYDPLGCSVVFHCDHGAGEYLVGWVQREPSLDTWQMTVIFNGFVVGLVKDLQADNGIASGFVIGHLGLFVRFLELGGIFDVADVRAFHDACREFSVTDLTEMNEGSDDIRDWVEARMELYGGAPRVLQLYNELRILALVGGDMPKVWHGEPPSVN